MRNQKACIIFSMFCHGLLFSSSFAQHYPIKFATEYEKQILSSNAITGKTDLTELLVASDPKVSEETSKEIKRVVSEFCGKITAGLQKQNTEESKVFFIYEKIKNDFLKQYAIESTFPDLFREGKFNYITATILHALVFSELKIPYEFRETPSYIFLMVYPATKQHTFRIDLPENGYFVYNDVMKDATVKKMVELRFITPEVLEENGTETVFDSYLFKKAAIPAEKAVSKMYLLSSTAADIKGQKKQALNYVRKAKMVFNDPLYEISEIFLIAGVLDESDFSTQEHFNLLADFVNLSNSDKITEYAAGVYSRFLSKYLYKNGEVEFVSKLSQKFIACIKNEGAATELKEQYYLALAGYYEEQGQSGKALKYADSIYIVNPRNMKAQSAISYYIIQEAAHESFSEGNLVKYSSYRQKYPFLEENIKYRSVYIEFLIFLSGNYFEQTDYAKALKYFSALDKELSKGASELEFSKKYAGNVYAEKCSYHCRNYQMDLAKSTVQKGLRLFPGHIILEDKEKIVKSEIERQKRNPTPNLKKTTTTVKPLK